MGSTHKGPGGESGAVPLPCGVLQRYRAHNIPRPDLQATQLLDLATGANPRAGRKEILSDTSHQSFLRSSLLTHISDPLHHVGCIQLFSEQKLEAKGIQLILVWIKQNNFMWLQDRLKTLVITPSFTHSHRSLMKKVREIQPLRYSPFKATAHTGAIHNTGNIQPCFLHHLRPWSSTWQRTYTMFRDCSLQCSGFSLCSQIYYNKNTTQTYHG